MLKSFGDKIESAWSKGAICDCPYAVHVERKAFDSFTA